MINLTGEDRKLIYENNNINSFWERIIGFHPDWAQDILKRDDIKICIITHDQNSIGLMNKAFGINKPINFILEPLSDEFILGDIKETSPNLNLNDLDSYEVILYSRITDSTISLDLNLADHILNISSKALELLVVILPYKDYFLSTSTNFILNNKKIPACLPNGFFLANSQLLLLGCSKNNYLADSIIMLVYAQPSPLVCTALSISNEIEIPLQIVNHLLTNHQSEEPFPELKQDISSFLSSQRELPHFEMNRIMLKCMDDIFDIKKFVTEEKRWKAEAEYEGANVLAQEQRINDILKSYSWRITAPLRRAFSVFQTLRAAFRHPHARLRSKKQQSGVQFDNKQGNYPEPLPNLKPGWLELILTNPNISIITCAFPYDPNINQRPIHLAEFMIRSGRGVVYIHWEWSWNHEEVQTRARQLTDKLWDVPLGEFLRWCDSIEGPPQHDSEFYLTFPAPQLVEVFSRLRRKGFYLVYDIMDEWEEFHAVGQAPWYSISYENRAILEADLVTCVAPTLKTKFDRLRRDIIIVPNGFSQRLANIWSTQALSIPAKAEVPTVGYFGHLTDSWFDWKLVIALAHSMPNVNFELVGSGEPDWARIEVENSSNIKLINQVPPAALGSIARQWRVAIIPFLQTPLARAVDPLKIYEYLFLELPSVVSGIDHLDSYPGVNVSSTTEDFVTLIYNRINSGLSAEECQEIKGWLSGCEWNERFTLLHQRLRTANTLRKFYD